MIRPSIIVRIVAAALLLGLSEPASAQFGSIFPNPPRPPGSVPGDPRPLPPPPISPQAQGQPANAGPVPALRGVQSQPLPPPPGAAAAPPPESRPQQSAATPPTAPDQQASPPSDPSLQPGDEIVVEPPTQKIVNREAMFAGLDKITGRIIKFDAKIGETVQFGALQVTPRACYTRPPTVATNTDGFVEVDEVTLQGEVKRIFTGWMFTTSPGLHAVEHPIYDVWLIDCGSPEPAEVASAPAPAAPPAQRGAARKR